MNRHSPTYVKAYSRKIASEDAIKILEQYEQSLVFAKKIRAARAVSREKIFFVRRLARAEKDLIALNRKIEKRVKRNA